MDEQYLLANAAVRLMTGGPIMQVEGTPSEGRLWCTWTANGYFFGGDFARDSLVIVDHEAEFNKTVGEPMLVAQSSS